MLAFTQILLLSYISGISANLAGQMFYLPHLKTSVRQVNESLREDTSYCLRMTWLGEKYDNRTFPEVMNKNCSEFFDKKDSHLCIDPMAVTFTGKKPDFSYVLNNYAKQATCKLSKDQVCAKYTIYFNGIESHVVRYCTRIDVDPEGPMQSGCLTEKKGSYEHEICACISGKGMHEICNKADNSTRNDLRILTIHITEVSLVTAFSAVLTALGQLNAVEIFQKCLFICSFPRFYFAFGSDVMQNVSLNSQLLTYSAVNVADPVVYKPGVKPRTKDFHVSKFKLKS